jgi:hypothetical protein
LHHPNHRKKGEGPEGMKQSRHTHDDYEKEGDPAWKMVKKMGKRPLMKDVSKFIREASWELQKQGIETKRDRQHARRVNCAFAWIDRNWDVLSKLWMEFISKQ